MKYKNYILVNKERSITNDEEYKFTLRNPITNQNSTVYVKYYLYHHVYFVGDIFQYGDTIYEIVEKGVWHAKCKYINETPKSEYSPKYLFINFSLYTRVKV